MSQNVKNVDSKELYKSEEFEQFLQILNEGQWDTWELVAETLGVHSNTIQKWKKHPKAQKALAQGLQDSIKKMEDTGRRDWRMWREKAAMLRLEMEKNKNNEPNGNTYNLNIMGDEALAQFLYGFVKDLSGNPEKSQGDASGGENPVITEGSTG